MYDLSLYHTLYETFALVDELYDPGFIFHAALTQLFAVMAVDLADAQVQCCFTPKNVYQALICLTGFLLILLILSSQSLFS